MAATHTDSAFLGGTGDRAVVQPIPLIIYLALWLALNAFALILWPDVVEPFVTLLSLAPLAIAYHLAKGSEPAWAWGLVFHAAFSLGATVLALTHSVLHEPDPVVITLAAGSLLIAALFASQLRLPFVWTRGWVLFLILSALHFGWTGLQTSIEARGEFPQGTLSAPAPWRSTEPLPREADLSFFTDAPSLIAYGERDGVSWAFYAHPSKDGSGDCIAFTENSQLVAGSCPLDFVGPDHLMSHSYSERESGRIVSGVVSTQVRGMELQLESGPTRAIRIVEPPAEAGLDVNVYFAFLPDGAGQNSYGISAFNAEGERIDRLGSWDAL